MRIIDLPILNQDSIGELILASAQNYKTTYSAEIVDMTKIVDP